MELTGKFLGSMAVPGPGRWNHSVFRKENPPRTAEPARTGAWGADNSVFAVIRNFNTDLVRTGMLVRRLRLNQIPPASEPFLVLVTCCGGCGLMAGPV
jgi:hypothetical protein